MPKNNSDFLDNRSELPPEGTPMVQIIQGWPQLMGRVYLKRTGGAGMRKLNLVQRQREWFIRHDLMTEEEDLEDRKVTRRLREWRKQQKLRQQKQYGR